MAVDGADGAGLTGSRPSGVRQLQAGATSWATVNLVDLGPGAAAYAIRSALEACDMRVNLFQVGQARHVVGILSGRERRASSSSSTVMARTGTS